MKVPIAVMRGGTSKGIFINYSEIIDKILMDGTAKAQKTAKETMKKVKQAMKLDY